MLDAFMDPQPARPTKPQPQQAQSKVPDYPSMLDAFNYPSPPFTRTGTPSITRAGTPAPVLGKVGRSNLALEMTNVHDEGNGDKQGDVAGKDAHEKSSIDINNRASAEMDSNNAAELTDGQNANGNISAASGVENSHTQVEGNEESIAGFGTGKMQRKKVVEEPSAASILDNFNF